MFDEIKALAPQHAIKNPDIEKLEAVLGADPDWPRIKSDQSLREQYALAINDTEKRQQGKLPDGYTKVVVCAGCGPVFLYPGLPEKVFGCPWCLNRIKGLPIPRPAAGQFS